MFVLKVLFIFFVISSAAGEEKSGWGISGSYGTGSFDFTTKRYLQPEREASGTIRKIGAAFVYDSSFHKYGKLGYRLSFGLERMELESGDLGGTEFLYGFNTDVLLKLGLINPGSLRFWTGPEIRFGFAQGSGGEFARYAASLVLGIGGVLGADIQVRENYIVSLTAGAGKEVYSPGARDSRNTTLKGDTALLYLSAALIVEIAGP